MPPADAPRPFVRPGQIVPQVQLDGPGGTRRLTGSGHESTLVVYLHADPCEPCARFLDELVDAVDALREWATALVAVVPPGAATHLDAFRVLHDRADARHRLGIGRDEAAVILADRWGEVAEAATIGGDHSFPLPRQLVESAKILDVSCGECNVPSALWRGIDDENGVTPPR